MIFTNFFMNCECIKTYIVINEIIIFEIYKRLQIESYFFSNQNHYEIMIYDYLNNLSLIVFYLL